MRDNLTDKVAVRWPGPSGRRLRISAVSFINTLPLIYGLEVDPSVELRLGVPSSLVGDLLPSRGDVAGDVRTTVRDQADLCLLPVIDFLTHPELVMLPATGIGCDGPTLTVRLFSRTPIGDTTVLAADPDSHTSVVLARVILQQQFGLRPTVVPLDLAKESLHGRGKNISPAGVTRLLIGDKVITAEPPDMPYQLDLGAAWRDLTGLPFVFATWGGRSHLHDLYDLELLTRRLKLAKIQGMEHVDELVDRHAVPRGWPRQVAREYLTKYLNFDIGQRQLQAIKMFHELAGRLENRPLTDCER